MNGIEYNRNGMMEWNKWNGMESSRWNGTLWLEIIE